jgi:hypothetical protein
MVSERFGAGDQAPRENIEPHGKTEKNAIFVDETFEGGEKIPEDGMKQPFERDRSQDVEPALGCIHI